ncbi:nitroreductase [Vibrio sp. AIC-3]|uniref:nitroreductase family protein n=1 Tax=Vibrio sp. AIC-3 TaxID=2607604 RepID=UPI00149363FB|nr:nitroreductase family protein [Vibrio sp. AIC-3]NOH92947.1 nitroreductase [Vibrio sp. AIC-3]
MPLEKQWSFEDSRIWKLKLKLQFSGWLQYIIHAIWIFLLLLIAGVGWLIGHWQALLFWLPLGLAALLSVALVGSIVMVKYGLHPAEKLPPNKNHLDAFDLMRSRQSCRSFQSRNLTSEHHAELLKFVQFHTRENQLLGQKTIRLEYIKAPLTVWPVVGAHEFLVAIAPKEYNRLSVIDVGRSLQKVVIEATRMGIATCWIGPGADNKSIVQHLGNKIDPTKDHVICVCAIGYESMYKPLFIRLFNRLTRKRLPLSELFFSDLLFNKPLDTQTNPFGAYGRCYEVCQWAPSSYNGQTTRCIAITEQDNDEKNLTRFDFYASINSRYYAPVALGIWCANWEIGCAALNKRGYFKVLPLITDAPELPRYDISWVVN